MILLHQNCIIFDQLRTIKWICGTWNKSKTVCYTSNCMFVHTRACINLATHVCALMSVHTGINVSSNLFVVNTNNLSYLNIPASLDTLIELLPLDPPNMHACTHTHAHTHARTHVHTRMRLTCLDARRETRRQR